MSTRKSALASSTVQGTKAENAPTTLATSAGTGTGAASVAASATAKTSDTKSNTVTSTATTTNIISAKQDTTTSSTTQLEKSSSGSDINIETKTFQQRVTRNSPLLLPSAGTTVVIKKEPLDPTDPTNSENEENTSQLGKKQGTIRGRKSIKDHKEAKEQQEKEKEEKEEKKEDSETKEYNPKEKEEKKDISVKESSDTKDSPKEIKDQKESSAKDSTNTPSASPVSTSSTTSSTSTTTTTATNRLTRKSTANQEIISTSSTRVTRQRQTGAAVGGVTTRSETPPAAARARNRGSNRVKMPLPMIEPITAATKRKRSVDTEMAATSTRKSSSDEPGPKYIKIEVRDPEIDGDEPMQASQTTAASTESSEETSILSNIKIKQEILDDSEMDISSAPIIGSDTTPSTLAITETSTTSTSSTARVKGRWATRKSNQATTTTSSVTSSNSSPSTRATRQNKQNSPVRTTAATEPKRRRTGSQTKSLLKVGNSSKAPSAIHQDDEEDSKDSVASSNNTDDIVLAHIKIEKPNMEVEEFLPNDDNKEDTNVTSEAIVSPEEQKITKEVTLEPKDNDTDIPTPLTVDTESVNNENSVSALETTALLTPAAASSPPSVSSGSEKAASLSPSELVSEGVSEISVKQFYKKPKFLENNLGIEEDPKLGNIVQKVVGQESATSTPSVDPTEITPKTIEDRMIDDSYSNESMKEGALRFDESVDERKLSITQDDASSLSSDDKLTPLVVDDEDDELEQEVVLVESPQKEESPKQIENEERQELKVSESDNGEKEFASEEINEKLEEETKSAVASTAVVVEEEQEEDELTIEESETISMDNNASVNDDATNEIEEDAENDGDIAAEIEDIVPITTATETEAEIAIVENKADSELSAPLQFTEESLSSDDHLVIDDKENIEVVNNDTDDDNKDVLAKIDAELKKIDERHREKLNSSKTEESEFSIVADVTPLQDEEKIVALPEQSTSPLHTVSMDVDEVIDDINLPTECDKIVSNDEIVADLELKLDVEGSALLLDDIRPSENENIGENEELNKLEVAEDLNKTENVEIPLMVEEKAQEMEENLLVKLEQKDTLDVEVNFLKYSAFNKAYQKKLNRRLKYILKIKHWFCVLSIFRLLSSLFCQMMDPSRVKKKLTSLPALILNQI